MLLPAFTHTPLFGLTLTLVAYAFALAVHTRLRFLHPLLLTCLHPLFLTCLLVMGFLLATHVAPTDYEVGGDIIAFFLGPATVALAVPLYKHRRTLAQHALQIAVTIFAGCIAGIASAALVAIAFHASRIVVLSVLSKCATTPITIEITKALAGLPALAAAVTVCSGLLGAVVGPPLLHAIGIHRNSAIGLAIGTSSHGIGTSSVIRHSELQGTYAGLAMALNGILTAAILTPLAPVIQRLF